MKALSKNGVLAWIKSQQDVVAGSGSAKRIAEWAGDENLGRFRMQRTPYNQRRRRVEKVAQRVSAGKG